MTNEELYTQNMFRCIEEMKEIVLALVEEDKERTFTLLSSHLTCLTAQITVNVLDMKEDRFRKRKSKNGKKANREQLQAEETPYEDEELPDTEGIK